MRVIRQHNQQQGFTLLEVLVALIVLSVGLTAVVISSIEITRNSLHLQDKTYAHWVAQNVITERQIQDLAKQPKVNNGTSTMANDTWQWRVETVKTELVNVQKIIVTVSRAEQNYASVTSYELSREANQ